MDRDDWDRRYSTDDLVWHAAPNRFVAEHLADLPPGSAIDLAGGEGRNALWLAERGWRTVLVDFSEVALDKARRLADDRGVDLTTVAADATTWSPEVPVDLVLVAYLQLPASAQTAVLTRAATWLRPGGTLFVVAHDRRNVTDGHGGPPSADVCYDLDRTVAALDGLRIEHAAVEPREVPTDDGVRTALDTVVRAVTSGASA